MQSVSALYLSVVNGIRIMLMGQGDATDGVYHWTYYGMYRTDCESGWMYTSALVAKKIGLDPAIMATPLISTLVDISTISVYFAIVSHVFQL